jgi:hypothetical protein
VHRDRNEWGQVGIAVIFTMIVVAAGIAWAVAAIATSPGSTASASSNPAPAVSPNEDPLDPENAASFDGTKHRTYEAGLGASLSGTVHHVTTQG